MALLARIPVPIEADATVRKVVLTDRYIVAATVSGWITALDLHALGEGSKTDLSRYQKTFQADRLWDIDCRDDTIATANDNGIVTLWDAQTASRKADLSGHVNLVKAVLLPPNQQTIVSGSRDASIIVWDAQSNQRRSTLTGHHERITMLKVFDNLLVSASGDGAVRVWDLRTDTCVLNFAGHDNAIVTCGMNDHLTLLATGGVSGEIKIWSVNDGTCVATCQGHTRIPTQFSNAPGNVLVSAAADGSIRSWDWATGNSIRALDAHKGQSVRGFVWAGNLMISGGNDGVLRVWDRETWEFRYDLRQHVCQIYQVVQRGTLLAVALLLHGGSSLVELWDLTSMDESASKGGS
ncbi:WD40-repeat-containing domain protein [Pyrenochaeta sp. MPI-SDFR-AT-0127]|nr:WD40-repeat-containing domain protein [Pyrenochaeta sp. MPI-SDFR-AT-0127]